VYSRRFASISNQKTESPPVPDPVVILVEDDPFTRLIPLVLDPNASEERRAAPIAPMTAATRPAATSRASAAPVP
jgi:hypothetical protein